MRFILLFVLLACFVGTRAAAADRDVVEQELHLAVTIDGHAERLEALLVHPDRAGRFPVALIVNGASPKPADARASWLAHLAHDFAHRGWLAAVIEYRGYATSSGALQDDAGTCTQPDLRKYLDAHAADLAAALAALHLRPDVDPAVTIGLGFSISGASMLDLAARPDHQLAAVINISGGVFHHAAPFAPDPTCGPFEDDLIHTVGSFGKAAIPTLWLYDLNDPWFQPTLVNRMDAAYRKAGGSVDLRMLPPFETDGHTLFRWNANILTEPPIDQFLRAHDLPSMTDDRAFEPILARLAPEDTRLLDYYLRLPTEKALAVPRVGAGVYLVSAERSIATARQDAVDRCQAISREPCRVVAENMMPVGAWTPAARGAP